MSAEISWLAAFLVGLLGGVHCVGMCGGIVGALSLGSSPAQAAGRLGFLFAYNGGRIFSYTLAGVLAGGISWFGLNLVAVNQLQTGLQVFAGLFLILLGLYIGGWWFGLRRVEQLGTHLWKRIEPYGRCLLPVSNLRHAFMLGVLWGWLPCGLVYSVVIWALSSANPLQGALLMFSFGLGTLPNLLAMGLFASALSRFVQHNTVKWGAGSLVIAFGVVTLYRSLSVFI